MNRVMLDLETLGLDAGCAIISLGAVKFNEPGSRTTDELLERAADDAGVNESTAKHHLGDMLVDDIVEKHPDFEGTYRIKNDPR